MWFVQCTFGHPKQLNQVCIAQSMGAVNKGIATQKQKVLAFRVAAALMACTANRQIKVRDESWQCRTERKAVEMEGNSKKFDLLRWMIRFSVMKAVGIARA
eukprot:2775467-Pleurochrysis_carterae.AAC.1